eukprot:Selendium_serpulae@DN5856_c0_g2_i3.p1
MGVPQIHSQSPFENGGPPLVGIVLSTLGRQGSIGLLERLIRVIKNSGEWRTAVILLSEITSQRLDLFKSIQVFVQIGCPRLSVDWGHHCSRPLLNSFEAFVAFGRTEYQSVYPMDYYSKMGGEWTNYFGDQRAGSQGLSTNRLKVEYELDATRASISTTERDVSAQTTADSEARRARMKAKLREKNALRLTG